MCRNNGPAQLLERTLQKRQPKFELGLSSVNRVSTKLPAALLSDKYPAAFVRLFLEKRVAFVFKRLCYLGIAAGMVC